MIDFAESHLNLCCFDHVHFYLEDVVSWRKWFELCLDFQVIASEIDETHTEILQHGSIQIRLSAPVKASSPVAKFLQNHPPGIAEVAFAVNFKYPHQKCQDREAIIVPSWGEITHRFIPSVPHPTPHTPHPKLFTAIDHLVINVPEGEMYTVASWYEQHMGLQISDRFHIKTDHSALASVVMRSGDRQVQIPINEPSTRNSQVQEFLDQNRGAGIQHLALHTHDIYNTVAKLKQRGVKFLETSPAILVDTQDLVTGQTLLQIFTQPIFGQPTFFFEIIQRQNHARGFGEGNFQSLFEAIEREQIARISC